MKRIVAKCPGNPDHDQFFASATIREEWIVGRFGDWEETQQVLDVTHHPDHTDKWTCRTCGNTAIFESEDWT